MKNELYKQDTNVLHRIGMSSKNFLWLALLPAVLKSAGLYQELKCAPLIFLLQQISCLLCKCLGNWTDGLKRRLFYTWWKSALVSLVSVKSRGKICSECKRNLHPAAFVKFTFWQTERSPSFRVRRAHCAVIFPRTSWVRNGIWSSSSASQTCSIPYFKSNRSYISVHLVLAKEWLSRIGNVFKIVKTRTGEERRCGTLGLIKLCGGDTASEVLWNIPQVAEIRVVIEQFFCNVLDGYLPKTLIRCYGNEDEGWNSDDWWLGVLQSKKQQCQHERKNCAHVEGIFKRTFLHSLEEISYKDTPKLFTKALYQKIELRRSKHVQHHALSVVDCIELLVHPSWYKAI